MNFHPSARLVLASACVLLLATLALTNRWSGTNVQAHRPATNQQLTLDLNNSFKKYQLARLDALSAFTGALRGSRITLNTATESWDLALVPHDLRAPNYRAETTGTDGARILLEPTPVHTFRGSVANIEGSEARFWLDGKLTEGLITARGTQYFVEPAKRYSKAAADDDLVIYDIGDFLAGEELTCSSLPERVESFQRDKVTAPAVSSAAQTTTVQAVRVLELATEADFEYETALGGATQANNDILSMLNFAEAAYQRDVGLTFSVTFQHVWTSPDPFSTADQLSLLNSFRDTWNASFTTVARDAAHLWSGKPVMINSGRSFLGTVCVNPTNAYGVNGKIDFVPQKFILTAHELGHNLNATHVDGVGGCADTIMVQSISNLNSFAFCPFSKSEINNFVAGSGSCLATQTILKNQFDYDGDGKADTTVFRPNGGNWFRIDSFNGAFRAQQFGASSDRIVPGDYDGDAKADLAVWRPSVGTWFVINSSNGTFKAQQFGANGDLPMAVDYDADNKTDFAVYRPSAGTWFILNSNDNSFRAVSFGISQDIPVAYDYDGDGKADIAVFRPSSGTWYILNSQTNSLRSVQFGQAADKPVPGDYDGDGKFDVAVFRPGSGSWFIINSGNNSFRGLTFGISTDTPVAADYEGDGRYDVAVFRAGSWYELYSSTGSFVTQQFGIAGDLAAPAAYVP